jgi:hypothetical protein
MAIVINGSGTVTGISVGGLPDDIVDAGTLADNAVGLAQMASGTDGNIITYDTSGNPAVVATGSDGQVLTSAGADAVPAFEAAAGGGKVLQVQHTQIEDETETTSASYVTTSITDDITPSATSSKVLVMIAPVVWGGGGAHHDFAIFRGATQVTNDTQLQRVSGVIQTQSFTYLDSPSTTSATTYTLKMKSNNGNTVGVCTNNDPSGITLMEIGA